MNDNDKVLHYEVHIEDMLHVLRDRLAEFGDGKDLSEFEQGRYLAYWEMMDIINAFRQHPKSMLLVPFLKIPNSKV